MTILEIARRSKMAREATEEGHQEQALRTDEKYEQIFLSPAPGEPGSSPDCPMLDVPAADWRWTVANWPHDRWTVWHHRVAAILAEADELVLMEDRDETPRADAEEIRAAGRRAFDELTRFAGKACP